MKEISVHEWQELYRAGAFEGKDLDTAHQAGWRNWNCHVGSLAGRLKHLAPIVNGIKEPFVLDYYFVWFANIKCHVRNASYDRIWFEPLDRDRKGLNFYLEYNSPDEPEKWTLYTERSTFQAPEFGCARVRDMVTCINKIAPELEQGIQAPFLDERTAAAKYAAKRDPHYPSGPVCRIGEHSYSFLDWNNHRRTLYVVRSLKDIPPDFPSDRTMKINGLYVYCPEDAGLPLPSPQKAVGKSHKKRKVRER